MKKVIIVLSFISIIFISSAYSEEYSQDNSSNGDVIIPPGMEVIKKGDVNIVVPKGSRLRKQDSVMLIETADEYASRKFEDTEEHFKKIEKKLEAQKKEIEDLKSAAKKLEEDGQKNDPYLIEACLKKDLAAWSILIKKYSGLIYVSIENRLKKYGLSVSNHDIEDIRQNILSDIWKNDKLSHITNRDDISYWIAILSGNAAVEHFRSRGARQLQDTVSLSHNIDEKELDEILPSDIPGPDDELARAETEQRIDLAIESLPAREKLMIKLHLIHDKKYHEIAEFLGVPKGTVSSYIKRAKEKLKEALKNN